MWSFLWVVCCHQSFTSMDKPNKDMTWDPLGTGLGRARGRFDFDGRFLLPHAL